MQRGSHPRYRGRGRGQSQSQYQYQQQQQKGLFVDKIWKCDCQPRLPAEHFRVKKDGKNHGRWFYTCQQQEPKRCSFFLWDEDAKPREAAAVMSNRTSEPQGEKTYKEEGDVVVDDQDGWNAGRRVTNPNPPPSTTPSSGSKRSLASTGFAASDNDYDDDDDDVWGLVEDDDDELLLGRVAQSFESTTTTTHTTTTPHKVQKTGVYATPTTGNRTPRKLPWLEEEERTTTTTTTPSKPSLSFSLSSAKQFQTPTSSHDPSSRTITTPTPPSRFIQEDISSSSSPTTQRPSTTSLTTTLLPLLSPTQNLSEIHKILSRYDLQIRGIAKGRDIARLALRAKEAKIVELQARITRLEAEREVDRAVIKKLRGEEGRGGGV